MCRILQRCDRVTPVMPVPDIIPDMRIKFKVLERPIKCLSVNCKKKLKLVITYIISETICPIIPDFLAYNTKSYKRDNVPRNP